MTIAITGATGLIGHELVTIVKEQKFHKMILLSRQNHEDTDFVQTDYSLDSLKQVLQNVDVVIHLAAIRGGDSTLGYEAYRENEILTENILKAMKYNQIKKIVFMSSISVYSDLNKLPWTEEQVVSPCNFYGLSKLTCEQLCALYAIDGVTSVILRCAHVLGYERRGYMLEKFMNLASKKETLTVMGKSIAKREFIYVKDVARAVFWAACNDSVQGVYNLGSTESLTNLEVAEIINNVFDNDSNLTYATDMPEGIKSSYMSSDKIGQCGFKTKYSFMDGVKDIRRDHFEN